MSDLNDDKKVNDLVEALILASSRSVEIKVVRDGNLQLVIDGIPHEFAIDFDVQTGLWFLEE